MTPGSVIAAALCVCAAHLSLSELRPTQMTPSAVSKPNPGVIAAEAAIHFAIVVVVEKEKENNRKR
ncbi:MAG: hypothetical protein LBH29_01600 [Elusimicrobiota bacterium]|nr:hypothetical protein [Elusimicrobiota bacterium]